MISSPTASAPSLPKDVDLFHFTAADGWPLRAYHQPARGPARGALLWLGGRGDFAQKYAETLDHWAGRGWDVTSVDWRGQGGSGRMTADPHTGHIDDFARWIADLAAINRQWAERTVTNNAVPASASRVALGHSMGGHLLLRGLISGALSVDRAVLVAPMLGLDSGVPFWLGRWAAHRFAAWGGPTRRAWKQNERPGAAPETRQSLLTHDDRRYAEELAWWRADPSLQLGPPSWGWMAAAYDSVAWLLAPGRLRSVRVPILIVGTEGDRLVSTKAMKRFADRLPDARLRLFGKEAAHEILREVDSIRTPALSMIDEFLERTGGRV